MSDSSPELVGPVEIGPIAHGGHCVTRHDGRVIFVRHALPGETARIMITDDSSDRFWRADAIEIREPSPDRVVAPCPVARPGLCGGCDFQHVDIRAQRRLKQAVVAEQLSRMAGLDWAGTVEAVPGQTDGLGWRTRMRYVVDDDGRAGLRKVRSHEVVAVPPGGCRIAHPAVTPVVDRSWPAGAELVAAAGSFGSTLLVDGEVVDGLPILTERVGARSYTVAADGFWQVHPAAAEILVDTVVQGLEPQAGDRAFDLYCGVGLFAGALADRGCRVWGVESARASVEQARHNLADVDPPARFLIGAVRDRMHKLPARADLVILDPPRSGAGRAVIGPVVDRRPRAIAYVACDPATLARDLKYAGEMGYRPISIRAFDLFPMTHHVECVAILTPSDQGPAQGAVNLST